MEALVERNCTRIDKTRQQLLLQLHQQPLVPCQSGFRAKRTPVDEYSVSVTEVPSRANRTLALKFTALIGLQRRFQAYKQYGC